MAKYYIKKQQRGKYYFYKVLPATGNKLKELMNTGAKIFDDRPSAVFHANNLKKGD